MHNSSLFASLPGLAVLLLCAIAAAYFGATLIAALLILVFLLSACALAWSRGVLSKTSVSLDDGQTACHAGDTLPVTLRIRSRSFFPLIWLDVVVPLGETPILVREEDDPQNRYTLPMARPFVGLRERFAWLLWQQEIACEETLCALRRGVVRIDRASLQAGDGLGMAADQRWAPLERPVRLAVYPRLIPVDIRPLLRLLSDAETGPRGQTEDVTLLKSSRPYQHGDPMKRINWRYLAMTGKMEVNQYETVTPGCITFLLDLFSFRYMETYTTPRDTQETRVALHARKLETMLSLIASCVRALSEQKQRYALIIPGYGDCEPIICPPGSGDLALSYVLEALAEVNYAGEEVRLPADEIRRMRRKLGTVEICSYSDAPTVSADLDALGCTRLRCIACLREEQTQTDGIECTLAEDLSSEARQEGGAA